jgi:ABC-type glutathione transport system ATPase component
VKSLIEARIWASEMLGFAGEVFCGKRGSIRALTEMLEPSGGV